MEAACHERVVVRGVAERHELHATVGIIVCGGVRDVLDDVAEQFDGVHVDAGFGGATFTEEQTMSVSLSAFGRERMSSSSAGVMDLDTSAE